MFTKVCPFCKLDFQTPYVSDKYCTMDCRESFKRDEKLSKWANGGRGRANPRNAFRLYGLNGNGVQN